MEQNCSTWLCCSRDIVCASATNIMYGRAADIWIQQLTLEVTRAKGVRLTADNGERGKWRAMHKVALLAEYLIPIYSNFTVEIPLLLSIVYWKNWVWYCGILYCHKSLWSEVQLAGLFIMQIFNRYWLVMDFTPETCLLPNITQCTNGAHCLNGTNWLNVTHCTNATHCPQKMCFKLLDPFSRLR